MQLVTAHHSESGGIGLDPHEENGFACMASGEHREMFATSPPKLYFTRFKYAGHAKWYYFHHALLTCLTICKSLLFMQIVTRFLAIKTNMLLANWDRGTDS